MKRSIIKNLLFIFFLYSFSACVILVNYIDLMGYQACMAIYLFSLISCAAALLLVKRYPNKRIWADFLQVLGGLAYFPLGLLTLIFYRRIVLQFRINPENENIQTVEWVQDLIFVVLIIAFIAYAVMSEKNFSIFPIVVILLFFMRSYCFSIKNEKLYFYEYKKVVSIEPDVVEVIKVQNDDVIFKMKKHWKKLSLKYMGLPLKGRARLIPFFSAISSEKVSG